MKEQWDEGKRERNIYSINNKKGLNIHKYFAVAAFVSCDKILIKIFKTFTWHTFQNAEKKVENR